MKPDLVKKILTEQGVTPDLFGDDKRAAVDDIAGDIADGFRKYPLWNDERRPSEGRKFKAHIFRYLKIWQFDDVAAVRITSAIARAAGAWWLN